MRDSCIFYRSFFEAMNGLDKETKANVYDAIFDYSLNGKEIELNGLEKTIFTLVKPQLDANNKRFENGKKGGKPKQNETKEEPKQNQNVTKTKPKRNQNVTKTEPNENVNENNNINDNEKANDNDNVLFGKEAKFNFKQELINLGADKNLVDEWILIRKTKKLTNTKTALESFVKEVQKKNKTINEVLLKCVTDSWGGFKASWDWKEDINLNNISNGKENINGFASNR